MITLYRPGTRKHALHDHESLYRFILTDFTSEKATRMHVLASAMTSLMSRPFHARIYHEDPEADTHTHTHTPNVGCVPRYNVTLPQNKSTFKFRECFIYQRKPYS